MLVRSLLELVVMFVVARSFWRLVGGIIEGLGGGAAPRGPSAGPPSEGVSMARDPICGTFVVPERALGLTHGGRHVYFCSAACRDAYRKHLSTRAEGRTA